MAIPRRIRPILPLEARATIIAQRDISVASTRASSWESCESQLTYTDIHLPHGWTLTTLDDRDFVWTDEESLATV